ncbi:amidohydrolase [archaeon BMS3Abin16]|nr:amidohydrolase [archaeon BMS3Abin16]
MTKIIDSHNHLGGPDRGDDFSQSPDEIIRRMNRAGVEMAVVFPFNEVNPGVSFSKANDFIAQAVERYPDRLIGFARLDPNTGDASLSELERAVGKLGLKGVKLHPKGQNFGPSNPYVKLILEEAAKLDVPVVFDSGKDIFDNYAISSLAEAVPEAKIIMAHMRGEGFIEAAKNHENIFLGSVKTPVERVAEALEKLGSNKIIAGSDSPYADMTWEMKDKFNELETLTSRNMKKMCGVNLKKLLKL